MYDLVVQSIEPGLRETLSNSYKMGSFRFEKVILGDTPIRVRGVKVYDEKKTDRNEIIMDMEVDILKSIRLQKSKKVFKSFIMDTCVNVLRLFQVIYAGDCDVRFSLSKMRAGIKDLQVDYLNEF